jgi:hypothetical protein
MLSDAEVIEELTGAGATIGDYFLIGEMPCCVNPHGGPGKGVGRRFRA